MNTPKALPEDDLRPIPVPPPVSSPPPKTGGLNELDRDRAASLADEGGVSAATVESQEKDKTTKRGRPPDEK